MFVCFDRSLQGRLTDPSFFFVRVLRVLLLPDLLFHFSEDRVIDHGTCITGNAQPEQDQAPNGEIAKIYEKGHKLKVDGITADGEWYRLLIYDPKGGTCYAYIYKKYTEKI